MYFNTTFNVKKLTIIGLDYVQIEFDTFTNAGVNKPIGDPVAVALIGDLFLDYTAN